MDNLNEIHWHDSVIESVIEPPEDDELIYNIQYPENWEQNIFAPKAITFSGYHSHQVKEMPFDGNSTILVVKLISEKDGFSTIPLETNAGDRFVTAKRFIIVTRHASI